MASIRRATVADAERIAFVHVTAWRETYRGLVPDNALDSLSIPDRTGKWTQILRDETSVGQQSTFVADEHGEVVGFANGGICRSELLARDNELYAIYLLDRSTASSGAVLEQRS